MARGWESKSVEAQKEAGAGARDEELTRRSTPEDFERQRKLESLRLSRARVLHDLDTATSDRYRETLKAALAHLDGQIAALSV